MNRLALIIIVITSTLTCYSREGVEWITARWYNANADKLPRILLVGDSICNGYQKFVYTNLSGTAYVSFYASSKCITDPSFLKELSYILGEYKYAVIHFNNGLHSLNIPSGKWESGLREALKLIKKKCPEAKIIWASSTPLKGPKLTEKAKRLNETAAKVMKEYNIPVNDLFGEMNKLDRNRYWVDTYHFTGEARKMQAKLVADKICTALGKKLSAADKTSKNKTVVLSKTGPDGAILAD